MKQNQPSAPHGHAIAQLNDGKGEYILYVVIPGMRRNEIEVNIRNRKLTVSAIRNDKLHGLYDRVKPVIRTWRESFRLPSDADTLMTAAVYYKGELEIHIPKGLTAPVNQYQKVHIY